MVPLIPVVMTHVRLPPYVKPTWNVKPTVKLKHTVQPTVKSTLDVKPTVKLKHIVKLDSQSGLQLRRGPTDVWTKRAQASWNSMSCLFVALICMVTW